ncbi:carboxylate--amine ligase [Arenibaculum pallidiluteum]|uniref:carboxylate--amine ligase n=1 Tax=Arenibaculum pallidiluteum TaxID=2812559 RepID=UPI001F3798C5|nr:ATP-grasp domain-containing protein [Arenibaculum pallidiluteum]
MNIVRPLGLAGISCVAVARPDSPTVSSRFTRAALLCEDAAEDADRLVEALLRFGSALPEHPVLFYEEDLQMVLVSRYRDRLAQAFRFVIANRSLIEDLVDKARFQDLAARLDLPVPKAFRVDPAAGPAPTDLNLHFPLIVKPLTRRASWQAVGGPYKALGIASRHMLLEMWPRFAAAGEELLIQEMIPGPETGIESYHVYVDEAGEVVGDFTGRKLRTRPAAFGHSTALTTTDAPDVEALGRSLVRRLGLRGVAKFDFKRGPDGRLHLLEVNPRFTLWHHVGAVAGMNLPALVYADLVGLPRPPMSRARAGVNWCHVLNDFSAARASGMSVPKWLAWAWRCEAKSAVTWDDPMPVLRTLWFRCFPLRPAPAGRSAR